MTAEKYDSIGKTYNTTRQADPRITKSIISGLDLGLPSTVADIGAGTGNYSMELAESGFKVIAVEPSGVMRRQGRQHKNLQWLDGMAEDLPLEDKSMDGVVCILAAHHFAGLRRHGYRPDSDTLLPGKGQYGILKPSNICTEKVADISMPTKNTEPITLAEFHKRFATEEACEQYLFKVRWPDGFVCPICGTRKYYWLKGRRLCQCAKCRRQTSVTAGTVMHRTRLPLRYWFPAMYLCATDKRGCSALSLMRILDVVYESAWLMLHKIRAAMGDRDFLYLLSGMVEVDDAYIGGESHNDPGSHEHSGRGTTKSKVAIGLSLTEKNKPAYLKMRVVDAMTAEELTGFVQDNVEPGSQVITDFLGSYATVGELGYDHECKVYDKEQPEYLKWIHVIIANAKAYIMGTYHGLDGTHLQAYLDEYCYRFNRRSKSNELFSRLLAACIDRPPLTFAELTG